jgi:hypothetical protein
MSEQNIKTTIFLDAVGRTILGELKNTTDREIEVTNPVILNIVPSNDGRMSVQLYPLFFREFLGDKNDDVTFTFQKSLITSCDINAIDFRLMAQYAQIFNKANVFLPAGTLSQTTQEAPQKSSSVINLFDGE